MSYILKEDLIKIINEAIPNNARIKLQRSVERPEEYQKHIGMALRTHTMGGAISIEYDYSFTC